LLKFELGNSNKIPFSLDEYRFGVVAVILD
jgi:hypothetical protein